MFHKPEAVLPAVSFPCCFELINAGLTAINYARFVCANDFSA